MNISRQQGQAVVLGAWLAMIGLATLRQVADPARKGLPPPSVYLGSGVLFTFFYGAAAVAPPLFATISVGVVLSALLAPYLAGRTDSGPIYQITNLLGGISNAQAPANQ